ncbi:MAG: hypothetical protein IJS26_01845 [Alphaproteobacteria bacterium]|nr:hypothetical protein [Alphaproteobacteria bacterium]
MISTKTAVTALWFTVTSFIIFGCFILKNQVHELETELKKINQNISTDVRNIHVLKAEWGRLNTPERLRKLAFEHIALDKIRAEQIINYSALPFENESSSVDLASTKGSSEYKKLIKTHRD